MEAQNKSSKDQTNERSNATQNSKYFLTLLGDPHSDKSKTKFNVTVIPTFVIEMQVYCGLSVTQEDVDGTEQIPGTLEWILHRLFHLRAHKILLG